MINIETTCMGCFTQHQTPFSVCPACGYDEAAQDAPHHQLRPRTILNGKYLLGKVLGQGGFGITYIGWDLNLDIKVAVKEFYPSGFVTREATGIGTSTVQPFTGSEGDFFLKGREKFIGEAKMLAKFFSLPGIVAVKDFFHENGTAYISMEYIDGQTLKSYLGMMGGKLPVTQVFDMMKPVMSSLAEIHGGGLIHRDISPDNIMINKEGYMKLLDFGAAREFADSGNKSLSIMLKPGFAPEEQYRSKGVQGPWTDVYALSATIYKCITGVTPDESPERIRMDDVKPPSALGVAIHPVQEAALMKGMAVLQENRWHSVAELYNALFGQQAGVPVAASVGAAMPVGVPAPVSAATRSAAPVDVFIPKTGQPIEIPEPSYIHNQGSAPTESQSWFAKNKAGMAAIAGVLIVAAALFAWSPWSLWLPGSENNMLGDTPDHSDSAISPSAEPSPTTDVPVAAPLAYQRGTVTGDTFSSEFLNLSLTAPEGYIMIPGEELDDGSVMEMAVTAPDGSVTVNVLAERLSLSGITEDEYLDELKTGLEALDMGYAINEDRLSYEVAGQTYRTLTAVTTELAQFYFVRKIEDRMVGIIVTCTPDSIASGLEFMAFFQPYDAGAGSAAPGRPSSTDAIRFPDPIFEEAVREAIGKPSGDIAPADVAAVTKLNVSQKGITDLTGIEYFAALEDLSCYSNELTALDVSRNTALTRLLCFGNELAELDVSNNTELRELWCGNNNLSVLDVSRNVKLTRLSCNYNSLANLDVSNNTALSRLDCGPNQLTSLDVSRHTALTKLDVGGNPLGTLDVSNNTALLELSCTASQLNTLDVSKNIALEVLWCGANYLTALDVSNNPNLKKLTVSRNRFASKSAIIGLDEGRTALEYDPQR